MSETAFPSIGAYLNRAWTWLLETRSGKALLIAIWLAVSAAFAARNAGAGKGLFGYVGPFIGSPFVILFVCASLVALGYLGDRLAKISSTRLCPQKRTHRMIYFLISCSGAALALAALAYFFR